MRLGPSRGSWDCEGFTVLEVLPAWRAFGPRGEEVEALLARYMRLEATTVRAFSWAAQRHKRELGDPLIAFEYDCSGRSGAIEMVLSDLEWKRARAVDPAALKIVGNYFSDDPHRDVVEPP